jgi:ABC-type transporter Mla subunit MlaD
MNKAQIEKSFYAIVGAQATAAKKVTARYEDVAKNLSGRSTKARDELKVSFEAWAKDGEKVIAELRDQKIVEDLTDRVHLDQISEQATKLRGQLEELVTNWRANFAPELEKAADKVEDLAEAVAPKKAVAKKPVAKKAVAKKPVAKKPVAKKAPAKAAVKPAAKKAVATKPAVKATATK